VTTCGARLVPRVVPVDDFLQLLLHITAQEGLLVHNPSANRAVPPKNIVDRIRACASSFDNYPESVRESLRGMRNSARKEEHGALLDRNIPEGRGSSGFVNDFEHHAAANLIEPLFSLIDVIIRSVIGSSNSHYEEIVPGENAFIIDRWNQKMAVLFDPLREINGQHNTMQSSAATQSVSVNSIDNFL
jgi:hypothetical protein